MPQTKRLFIDVKRRTAVIPLLLALAAGAVLAQQQRIGSGPLATGTATIRGRVVDAQTNVPLPEVTVSVFSYGADFPQYRSGQTKTNAEGRYEFALIAEGRYQVAVQSRSHLTPMQSSQVTALRDQVSTADFELTPGATARGRVVDRQGKPVARARVRFAARGHTAPMMLGLGRPALTSADGSFTLAQIPPGQWTIEIDLPRPSDAMRPPVIYHPGVFWREEATTIEVRAGETIENLEVVVPRVTENGLTVHVAASAPVLENMSVSILSVAPLAVHAIGLSAEGSGTIKGLIEGRYFVAARAWSRDQAFVAFEVVNFVQDSQEVSLHMQRAGRITGRIIAQRGGLPSLDGVRVGAAWVHDDVEINPLVPDNVEPGPDGRFTINGLFGRRKMELGGLSPDWRIQSVLQGRTDVTGGVEVPPNSTVDLTIVLARR